MLVTGLKQLCDNDSTDDLVNPYSSSFSLSLNSLQRQTVLPLVLMHWKPTLSSCQADAILVYLQTPALQSSNIGLISAFREYFLVDVTGIL